MRQTDLSFRQPPIGGSRFVPEAWLHSMMHRDDTLDAVLPSIWTIRAAAATDL